MNRTHKILIYTLGNAKSYKETTYELNGEKLSSKFISDIYLSQEKPERVLFFGTAGSGWEELYSHFAKLIPEVGGKMDDQLIEALAKAEGLKQNAQLDVLNELSRQLTACFQVFAMKDFLGSVRQVTIQLLRYGSESDVNTGNYQLLMNSLREQVEAVEGKCEVSFDITHGFRSIPFFNYTILEYLRCLMPGKVEIGKIYYGAFDNKTADNVTSVEDYTMVRDVMELTRAVEEFKHTGRTRTLASLEAIKQDKGFCQALEAFDWAIQCNAYDDLTKGISSLFKYTEQSSSVVSPHVDARVLLSRALRQAIFERDDTGEPGSIQWQRCKQQGVPMQQLFIARWLCAIENYGQASLVATEALMRVWTIDFKNKVPVEKQPARASELTDAVKRYFEVLASKRKNETEIRVSNLYTEYNTYIRIFRNIYAHNLDNDDARNREVAGLTVSEIRDKLKAFIKESMQVLRCINGQSSGGLNPADMNNLLLAAAKSVALRL